MADDRPAIGLQRGTVSVVPSDPAWSIAFAAEAERIIHVLSDAGLRPVALEHIGSTAVPGLVAKPIIDVMAGYERGAAPDTYVAALVAAGYELRGPQGVPDRLLLVFGPEANRTHHLNLVEAGGEFWRDHLLFRDRLIAEPGLAEEYLTLKQELAARYPTERDMYTSGKAEFVRAAIR
jgi:GrpB-like predicted nucleotidyltransferase (UPF0157 family)